MKRVLELDTRIRSAHEDWFAGLLLWFFSFVNDGKGGEDVGWILVDGLRGSVVGVMVKVG